MADNPVDELIAKLESGKTASKSPLRGPQNVALGTNIGLELAIRLIEKHREALETGVPRPLKFRIWCNEHPCDMEQMGYFDHWNLKLEVDGMDFYSGNFASKAQAEIKAGEIAKILGMIAEFVEETDDESD